MVQELRRVLNIPAIEASTLHLFQQRIRLPMRQMAKSVTHQASIYSNSIFSQFSAIARKGKFEIPHELDFEENVVKPKPVAQEVLEAKPQGFSHVEQIKSNTRLAFYARGKPKDAAISESMPMYRLLII